MSNFRLGIDIGGTFTDLNLFDESTGAIRILKTPSIPDHPSQAVVNGIREAVDEGGLEPADIHYFVHGTTLALNTLIQRNGATCGLLVTQGFKDILELQRLRLPNPHELYTDKVTPLVKRQHVREIDERMLSSGDIYRNLDPTNVITATQELLNLNVTSITICFLHAYKNDYHERIAKEAIQKAFPGLYVSTSSEVWPQQREYERALITVINSYVGGAMQEYFQSLEQESRDLGLRCQVLSTKSNGGIMSVGSARELPVQTLLSGPASGVMGAMYVGDLSDQRNLITFDLGGTSADIAVINGQIPYSTDNKVGDYPMIMPVVDIASIGAGGGSIAWTDSTGVLKVGPASAGASPGPAAYGRGGNQPTLTDAYIVTGILDPLNFLGGKMPLSFELALQAIGQLGARIGLDAHETAEAMLRVATSNMYAELLPLMARQGVDVNDFALLPYGGAGPTHVFMLAREIGVRKVVVPRFPGTLCALGALIADIRGDFIRTVHADTAKLDSLHLEQIFLDLEREAELWLDAQRVPNLRRRIDRHADMRYHGQSFETPVDLHPSAPSELISSLSAAFHSRYHITYGYADPEALVEVINLRVSITGVTPKPALSLLPTATAPAKASGSRQVYLGGTPFNAAVYQREPLTAGHRFSGPAIVEQYDSTTFVPAGFDVEVDVYGNLIGVEH